MQEKKQIRYICDHYKSSCPGKCVWAMNDECSYTTKKDGICPFPIYTKFKYVKLITYFEYKFREAVNAFKRNKHSDKTITN